MKLTDWWKNSSKAVTEAHYAQRFNEAELADLRRGVLNAAAREKVERRLRDLSRLQKVILTGCGVPFLILFAGILSLFGYASYNYSRGAVKNPVALIFGVFFLLLLTLILFSLVWIYLEKQKFNRLVIADLSGSRVGIEQGRVKITVIRSKNNSRIEFRMNETKFPNIKDVIGTEIYDYLMRDSRPVTTNDYETAGNYRFYFLPQSKLILHYERL